MRYVKATCYIEGEAIVEPRVPLCCIGFLRWVAKITGASIVFGPVKDTKDERHA